MNSIKLKKLQEIYDGWKNYVFQNKEVEETAKKRISICVENTCGFFKENKTCGSCGCFMPAKVRSPKSKCPENYW